jgi:hypothetical protein
LGTDVQTEQRPALIGPTQASFTEAKFPQSRVFSVDELGDRLGRQILRIDHKQVGYTLADNICIYDDNAQ